MAYFTHAQPARPRIVPTHNFISSPLSNLNGVVKSPPFGFVPVSLLNESVNLGLAFVDFLLSSGQLVLHAFHLVHGIPAIGTQLAHLRRGRGE